MENAGFSDKVLKTLAIDARNRVQALSDVATAIAQAKKQEQIIEVILNRGMRIIGVDICAIYSLNDSRSKLELIGERGITTELIDKAGEITLTSTIDSEVLNHVLSGKALWVENKENYQIAYPALALRNILGEHMIAFGNIPLFVEGGLGGLYYGVSPSTAIHS